MLKLKHRLYLRAFAEGSEGAGDTGGTDGSIDTGFADQSDADGDLFSYQETEGTEASPVRPGENGKPDGDDYQAFREKYKDRIGEEIQGAIQRRFKNQQSFEDSYNDLVDSLAPLFLKYGLEGSDIDGLRNALAQDDSLLEDMAFNEGLTTEAIRERMKDRQENARLQKELDRIRNEQIQEKASRDAFEQYNKWMAEAEDLKKLYPNFNLEQELENEEFRNELINSSKPLRKVFEAVHLDEIIGGAVQTTALKTREAITNDIRARGMRPAENGTRTGAVSVKKNVNELTDKDIDRIYERVKRGDSISF